MMHLRTVLSQSLGIMALATVVALPLGARADEYSDVSQLLRNGKHTEALSKADQFLAGKPRDPQMRFIKGVVQTEAGRPADAIATFTKLTEDFPELPEPYNNLAVLYASQSQFDKARAALEMAIRTNPSYATAHENLGDVYAKLASQAYSKALQLDSSNTAVQPKLALIRELFAPSAKGQKPGTTPSAAAAAAAAKAVAAASPAAPAPAVPTNTASSSAVATPVPAAPATAPATPATAPSPEAPDVEAAVRAWATAWSSKDVAAYLATYAKEFDPAGGMSRKAWEEERRARIVGKSSISVKVQQLNVTVNGNKASAKFRQEYKADSLNVSGRKTLELIKSGDRWLIVKETSGN